MPSEGITAYQETFVQRDQPSDLRPRIPRRGADDHSDAWVPGQPAPLRPSGLRISRHRVVSLSSIFWGGALRINPLGYPYTATNQVGDLDAVITQLRLQQVILVAHDASGPPAIDWALAQSERVAGLVLLNTYYCAMPTLRPPEAIWLFSTPLVRNIARPVSQMFGHWIFRRMYQWQVGRFFRDAEVRNEFLPLLYQQFDATPGARPAFFRLNEDLLPTIQVTHKNAPQARRVQTAGPDHLWRRRPLLEQRRRPALP